MWIDAVFSGGGVKAFAFAGALDVFERAGFQFKRTAGTSAGAIVAALLAAGYTASEMKQVVRTMRPDELLDPAARLRFPFYRWLRVYFKMGLYSGDALEQWLVRLLAAKGIRRFRDLPPDTLKIVAADVSRSRMIVFPDDLETYRLEPGMFSVARAVRMSASLPFFFEPVPLYYESGKKSLIVDGGILSNFPLWVFNRGEQLPTRPFIGMQVRDGEAANDLPAIHRATDLFRGLFSTMRRAHDARTLSKLEDSNVVTISVEKVSATDFTMHETNREVLYQLGAKAADDFLKKWTG